MKSINYSLLFLLLLFVSHTSILAQNNTIYLSEDGKCSLTFPGPYEVETSESESSITKKVTANVDSQTFFFGMTLHETEMVNHEEMAEVSLESFNKTVNGTVLSSTEWKLGNHKGIKAMIALKEQEAKIEYRAILIGNNQYQVVYLALEEFYNEKAAKKFFKSFTIGE